MLLFLVFSCVDTYAIYAGWVFNAGFAAFMANPTLIGFPL
jgi:hypothetical protein